MGECNCNAPRLHGCTKSSIKNVYHTKTRLPIGDAEIALYDRTILSQTDATVTFSIPYSFDFNKNGCIIVKFPEEYNSASSVTGVTVLKPLINATRIQGSGRTVSWCIQSPSISLSPETTLKFKIHGNINPDVHGAQTNPEIYLADSEYRVLTKQVEGISFPVLSTQMTQSMTRFHDYSISSGKNVKVTVSMVVSINVPRSGKIEIVFSSDWALQNAGVTLKFPLVGVSVAHVEILKNSPRQFHGRSMMINKFLRAHT